VTNFDDVGHFHEKFGLDNTTHHAPGPRMVTDETIVFRTKFMYEELKEFQEAMVENDMPGAFDALLDLVYVAMGTAHLFGFPWQEGWDAVQTANMQKVRATTAEESKRGSTLDVVKPMGWTPPDIAAILEQYT
jgi:predicted HAD superfamily Cof-like phosphohydrolase